MGRPREKSYPLTVYWIFVFLYYECLAHASMFSAFVPHFRFAIAISAALGLLMGFFTGLLPRKAAVPVCWLLSLVVMVLYGSQMVYCFIFGTPYAVQQMGLGAGAVSQFWREMLATMAQNWPWIGALLLPLAVLPIASCWARPRTMGKAPWLLPVAAAALLAVVWGDICLGGRQMFSNYYFFLNPKSTTAQTMERFGVPATFLLEMARPEAASSMSAVPQLPAVPEAPVPEAVPEATEPERYNVLPVNLSAQTGPEASEPVQLLNNYFSQLPGTKQNPYTGLFRDHNLILICAESFSPAAVDPVYTPTLYKLTHEGFRFHNYYDTFPNTTTDGEYAMTQGLFPDPARDKYASSMMASAQNQLPFALGNIFREQLGVPSFGYHNNVGNYYRRDLSHPNMGYTMKFNRSGMEFSGYWPTSDLEMMEQSVDDYIHLPQFHAYYMTFSGHYQYNPKDNGVVRQNYQLVENGPWKTMQQKSYIACHIELDKALEYLMTRLEEAGKLENTVIVLASDHTPYGLPKEQYFQMLGQEEDFFRWYKSNLILWSGSIQEPVDVEQYCCTVDILPTLLNLWGFSYDSRMLAGTDIFSDGVHAAVLIDHSFLTDQVWFNANTGQVQYLVPEDQVPEGYVDAMNQLIAARFDMSAQILRTNYYQYLLPPEPVPEPAV